MNEVILYRNAKHGITRWKIWQQIIPYPLIIMQSEAKIGDTPMIFTERVPVGKAGRTVLQQLDLRMNARIRNKLDNGYVHTEREARNSILTNQLGFLQPMLAHKFQDLKKFNKEEYYFQNKLDGHRCLITRVGNEIIAYSRRGKPITTITEILYQLQDRIPEGITLDGELYVHGQPLQTIASWAKRRQKNTSLLSYVVYDVMEQGMPYSERYRMLNELQIEDKNIYLLSAQHFGLEDSVVEKTREAKSWGYEGLILRHQDGEYDIGRRTNNLIKVKQLEDTEVEVVDVIPSAWNWGILVCKAPNGKEFKVSAPGNLYNKRNALNLKEYYIGKYVTIEYPNLTSDGIPFHAVATRWREDI